MAVLKRKLVGKVVWSVILIGVFLALAAFAASFVLDNVDQRWVTCEVFSAAATRGSRADPLVGIRSSCGTVDYQWGIDSDSAARRVAWQITPHRAYEFKLGWTSREISTRWPREALTAHAWRQASGSDPRS